MGLGGYLAWTAVAREIVKSGKAEKVLPCEIYNNKQIRIIENEIWVNNPYVTADYFFPEKTVMLQLNNPETNYCKRDTLDKAYHRWDKHIIEQICEFYEIQDPVLKCELFFTEEEMKKVFSLTINLNKEFVTIEPGSKTNYTQNRIYPFDKWQKVVDELSEKIQIVQIGRSGSRILDNVIDMTGHTTFREAALLIGKSRMFLSTEGGLTHASTATNTPALVVITGYQHEKMVAYPQNINLNIASHGPCGLKKKCSECAADAVKHEWRELINIVKQELCL
jgi:ADP-heptose:LPS heptosyltransferase